MYTISSDDKLFNAFLLLLKTRRALFRTREMELYPLGITPEQCEILYILKIKKEGISQKEIARLVLKEPHSVSSIIDRMMAKGLVKKTKDSKQKNLVRIFLTTKGKDMHECSSRRESVHNVMSVLSEEELSRLYEYLEKLLNKGIEELDRYYLSPHSKRLG